MNTRSKVLAALGVAAFGWSSLQFIHPAFLNLLRKRF